MNNSLPEYVNKIINEWKEIAIFSYNKYLNFGRGIVLIYEDSTFDYVDENDLKNSNENNLLNIINKYDPENEILINFWLNNKSQGANIKAPRIEKTPKNLWLKKRIKIEKIQQPFINFLKDEGFIPELDEFAISFKHQKQNYFISFDENDLNYFSLLHYEILSFTNNEEEHAILLLYNNIAFYNAFTKLIRIGILKKEKLLYLFIKIDTLMYRKSELKIRFNIMLKIIEIVSKQEYFKNIKKLMNTVKEINFIISDDKKPKNKQNILNSYMEYLKQENILSKLNEYEAISFLHNEVEYRIMTDEYNTYFFRLFHYGKWTFKNEIDIESLYEKALTINAQNKYIKIGAFKEDKNILTIDIIITIDTLIYQQLDFIKYFRRMLKLIETVTNKLKENVIKFNT